MLRGAWLLEATFWSSGVDRVAVSTVAGLIAAVKGAAAEEYLEGAVREESQGNGAGMVGTADENATS